VCAITPTVDPAVAKDGHTYERKTIEDWFEQSSGVDSIDSAISPKTGDVIGRQLTPNHAMGVMIGDEESKGSMAPPPPPPRPPVFGFYFTGPLACWLGVGVPIQRREERQCRSIDWVIGYRMADGGRGRPVYRQ
jgi:hypothetical protein